MSKYDLVKSPWRMQGNKYRSLQWLLRQVPRPYSGRWIEPFLGTGVVGLNEIPDKAILADNNPHVINFFSLLQKGYLTPESVCTELLRLKAIMSRKKTATEGFNALRERFSRTEPDTGVFCLFLHRQTFNRFLRFDNTSQYFTGGFGKVLSKKNILEIGRNVEEILRRIKPEWEFLCQDFRDTLEMVQPGDIVYCDPPYKGLWAKYYTTWNESQDEEDLFRLLNHVPGTILLSTWVQQKDHEKSIDENSLPDQYVAHGFNMFMQETKYQPGNKKQMQECLLIRYEN